MKIQVERSTRKDKKLMATIGDTKVHFGAIGFSDFTKNKDPARKANYIARLKKTKTGACRALHHRGFGLNICCGVSLR
jgi:hypothetical protein